MFLEELENMMENESRPKTPMSGGPWNNTTCPCLRQYRRYRCGKVQARALMAGGRRAGFPTSPKNGTGSTWDWQPPPLPPSGTGAPYPLGRLRSVCSATATPLKTGVVGFDNVLTSSTRRLNPSARNGAIMGRSSVNPAAVNLPVPPVLTVLVRASFVGHT